MNNIKKTFKVLMATLCVFSVCFALTACSDKNKDKRQYVDIILVHPISGENIKDYGWIEFTYDENFIMPEVKLKLKDKNKYLDDKDFDNGSWKSHMQLLIARDGTYFGPYDLEKDWPKNPGQYEMKLKFNEDGWVGEKSIDDNKYFRTILHFTLKINMLEN